MKKIALLGCLVVVAAFSVACHKTSENELEDLYGTFVNPPKECRPYVRWWWNGAKLTAGEIDRELEIMDQAGIGGVEINTIRFPGDDDLGIASLDYLSPEWIQMVKYAIESATRRGMTCDIIVGSGWPFGAEFLEENERTQLLTKTSRKLTGPATVTLSVPELLAEAKPQVGYGYDGQTSCLHSLTLAPAAMDSFVPGTELPFEEGAQSITITVPEGDYVLYALVKVTGFQAVINGGPGASGPVLNHYDKDATLHFLGRMSDNLFPEIKGTDGFRALFCDSMELEGANWCDDFAQEFLGRKGYDITPYLPFIVYKVGYMGHAIADAAETVLSGVAAEEVSRARYDFFTCCMSIIQDRFLRTFDKWCNENGFKSRVQAYGREFHPVDASTEIDIPECETWFWHTDGAGQDAYIDRPAYTNVNKSVASAVHFRGERLVSCEEITNTEVVFNASLEAIKMTGDQSNLSGVTHSILHGFNYSPAEAPFPGWVQYGTYLNERNPIWPYFHLWAEYKARISAVLMNSDYFADIALMMPLGDQWTTVGPQRDPFPALHYPPYADQVWAAIHRNGNACDYVSESFLQGSSAKNGNLIIGGRKYPVLMLVEVESMMPATAQSIKDFVAAGGKLVLVGKVPSRSVGLLDWEKNDAEVAEVFSGLLSTFPDRIFQVPSPEGDITSWYTKVQKDCGIVPYLEISRPSAYISQIRHNASGNDIYFIVNSDPVEGHLLQARFHSEGTPVLWDPESGARTPLKADADGTLCIPVGKAGSKLIVFENGQLPLEPCEGCCCGACAKCDAKTEPVTIPLWNIRFDKVDGTSFTIEDSPLFDLSQNPRTSGFAGVVTYSAKVSLPAGEPRLIDLGQVFGISEVFVNGEQLSCGWYGDRRTLIPASLTETGTADITVRLTTTLGNYMKTLSDSPTAIRWTAGQPLRPAGLIGPVSYR